MSNKRVIHSEQLPWRLPVFPTITLWLLLDRLSASGVAWGIAGTLTALLWIRVVVSIFNQTPTKVKWEDSK